MPNSPLGPAILQVRHERTHRQQWQAHPWYLRFRWFQKKQHHKQNCQSHPLDLLFRGIQHKQVGQLAGWLTACLAACIPVLAGWLARWAGVGGVVNLFAQPGRLIGCTPRRLPCATDRSLRPTAECRVTGGDTNVSMQRRLPCAMARSQGPSQASLQN